MAQALPGGAKWVERTTPEMMIEKMLAERREIRAKTRLTWNPERPPQAPLDRVVGDVNLSLPYMKITTEKPGLYFYIQNSRLYRSNGREVSFATIKNEVSPATLSYLLTAFDNFVADSIKRDPSVCKICKTFRADSYEDYSRHMVNVHPDQIMAQIEERPEVETAKTPEEFFEKTEDQFACCGKTFKNRTGLSAHKRFGHKQV